MSFNKMQAEYRLRGVSFWGTNLIVEDCTVNVGSAGPNIAQLNFSYGPPRVTGATVSYGF